MSQDTQYLQAVLARASRLQSMEAAAMELPRTRGAVLRGSFAALLAALMAMYPSVSAAARLIG